MTDTKIDAGGRSKRARAAAQAARERDAGDALAPTPPVPAGAATELSGIGDETDGTWPSDDGITVPGSDAAESGRASDPPATERPSAGGTSRRARTKVVALPIPYINRELSWLEYGARVLQEAHDERNPLLERVRFLTIFTSMLDEFFGIRVAGLKRQRAASASTATPDGLGATETLHAIRSRVLSLVAEHAAAYETLCGELADEGIRILTYAERPERHVELRERFVDEIFPVLTPLAVDPGHPFPYISDRSLSLAVMVRDPETGDRRFARVKVPPVLPRLQEVGVRTYIPTEQIIAANMDLLFPGMEVLEHHLFRVTRNADLAIEEDEADDLLLAIEEELRKLRFGEAVRLEVEQSMPPATRALLLRGLGVAADDVYEVPGLLDLSALTEIADLDIPTLQPPPWQPVVPPRLVSPDEDEAADVFQAMREGDILLHHPYESFGGTVQRFIEQAADDPDVLTIKMTLYRTSGDSPIVLALIRAAEEGKQVVVLVEIKARNDEKANIVWARALERAGAHVVYGLLGLKTHAKAALVVRREGRGLRRYVHIGTGNYNPKTARIYVDLGLLTTDQQIGADLTDLFNFLTGHSRQRSYRKLLVAPHGLREAVVRLIDQEIRRAEETGTGRVTLKLNSLVDPLVIAALCRASQAGVSVDLIVRGMCSLRPGVPGVSDNIRVRSIVGRYLEHSRILSFGPPGEERFWIGSADMMERNLDRRVEAVAPVDDPALKDRLRTILQLMLTDDRRAWELDASDTWRRVERTMEAPPGLDTFATLMGVARASLEPTG